MEESFRKADDAWIKQEKEFAFKEESESEDEDQE